jgi:hypothetical protein
MQNGVIYIAFGERYVGEAIFSAESLKQQSDLPITLFTDLGVSSPFIDSVVKINPEHKRAKVDFIGESPYERTLYLDSDTKIVRDISDVFGILDKFDVAAAHDHSRKTSRWSSKVPAYAAIPYAFPEYNGGVLLFRRSEAAQAFLALWRTRFHENKHLTNGQDQATLRISLWESDVKLHTLPPEFNVRNEAVRQKIIKRAQQPEEQGVLAPRIYHWHGLSKKTGIFRRLRDKYKPMAY